MLKLLIENTLVKVVGMEKEYKILGNYIRLVDERNRDLAVTKLLGVSISKKFIPSIANIVGTDLSNYKIVRTGQFAYGPVTSRNGEKISIAYLDEEDCIISSSYTVFEVENKEELDPEYLMLWFSRPEFDRYARYKSHGSVREIFDWNELCMVELPVPDIEKQRNIVKAYKTITDRIALKQKINDNLEAQAFAIYKETISNREKCAMLSDIAEITMGTSPEGESFNADGIGTVFYQGRTDFGFRFPTIRLYTTEPKRFANKGDILMSVRAPVGDINIAKEHCAIGRGLAALRPKNKCYSYLYYTMMELNFELKKFNDEGTVFGSITKDDLFALNVVALSPNESISFEKKVSIIDDAILQNETEIQHLLEMSSILLSKITD